MPLNWENSLRRNNRVAERTRHNRPPNKQVYVAAGFSLRIEDTIGFPIPQQISNILVIRPGALGDFILTLPVFSYLRRKFPQAHIEIMGYLSITEIAVGRHYADSARRFDQPEVAYLFLKDVQLPTGLARYLSGLDMIISFLREDIFAENLKRASKGYVLSHDPFPGANGTIHIIDHLLSALGGWTNVAQEERIPRIFLTEGDRRWAVDFLGGIRRRRTRRILSLPLACPERSRRDGGGEGGGESPVVALHPGSGGRKKCWPVENFVSLALHLRKELDAQLLLVSGPADEEATSYFLNYTQPKPPLLHNLPLPKLAAILERCDLFVGNDSGITHLAAATGVTAVALFGPTDPMVWGPRGERVKIIQGKGECSPCSPEERDRCQGRGTLQRAPTCMEVIPTGQVIKAVEEVLRVTYPLTEQA